MSKSLTEQARWIFHSQYDSQHDFSAWAKQVQQYRAYVVKRKINSQITEISGLIAAKNNIVFEISSCLSVRQAKIIITRKLNQLIVDQKFIKW